MNVLLNKLRGTSPLVVCVTNLVTANDCANLLLALGARPVMSDDKREIAELVAAGDALYVNTGTLSGTQIPVMREAAATAKKYGVPAVLDAVGAGATRLRTATALELLASGAFQVVRGNASELSALAGNACACHGVDAGAEDTVTPETAAAFARRYGVTVSVSGATDLITDGHEAYLVANGVPMMTAVTGCGCMLSAATAAFMTATDNPALAAAQAAQAMGIAGEIARARLGEGEGTGTFRTKLIDAVNLLDAAEFERRSNVEKRTLPALCRFPL